MFTVCPKCALTLVVTAADLRVAQGYVRCGRCSNVFNAIAALTEDRGNAAGSSGTASTTIMRKAPSIEDLPAPQDTLSDTGESEAIYAEPQVEKRGGAAQEVFIEAPQPQAPMTAGAKAGAPAARAPASSPAAANGAPRPAAPGTPPRSAQGAAAPSSQRSAPAATNAPAARAPAAPPPPPEFTDSVPDIALEFNPNETDISQVFVEAPPMKIDLRAITGTFEQLAPKPEIPPPAPPPPPPRETASAPPAPRKAAPAARQPPQPSPPAPEPQRYSDDTVLEDDDVRPVQLATTGKQPAQRTEAAPTSTPAPAASRAPKPGVPKRAASEDVIIYQGSPYNSADAPANRARKAAVEAARRKLAAQPAAPAAAANVADDLIFDDQEFDAPPADDAGALAAVAALARRSMPRGRRLAWIGGFVGLALLLAIQAIHHNRNDLATSPLLNRPLTRLYAALGVPLVPRWNLASYEVRQLGAFSGAGNNGNLTVRASLKNNADQPLPLPLLRITVQDRYGNRIATRDVQPKSYVPGAVPEDAHLGAGQRIDAEMSFKDPGREAVGFEIDACLPRPEGRIACANDVVAAR